MYIIARLPIFALVVALGLLACSDDQPATTVSKAAATEPLPTLRTGSLEPTPRTAQSVSVQASWRDASHEYLQLSPQLDDDPSGARFWSQGTRVELSEAAAGDLAVVANADPGSAPQILLRRQLAAAAQSVSGAVWIKPWLPRSAWERWPFTAVADASTQDDPSLKARWNQALAQHWEKTAGHPWFAFAAGRLRVLQTDFLLGNATAPAAAQPRPARRTELARLMETTSGALSMQEALQSDRGLRLDRTPAERNIAVTTLQPPPLAAHPFAAMQAQLPKPAAGTPEPMARAVPAEFWYARVDDIRMLLRLLDAADAWMTPVVQILQSSPEDRRLASRYQAQLGLERSGLAKLFGHTVVGAVALTGSDPYLREGSDVTLIFEVKQAALFEQELGKHLRGHAQRVADLESSSRDYAGVTVLVNQDPQRIVRQQRAQIGNLAIVSNSHTAIERVIDAIQGNTARLSDEADLRYMLARDPGQHQAFAFLSDRFIAAVIGPQQKIQAARRQQALAELLTPGYAALLHGWLHGRAPVNTAELLASGLLGADELAHADGSRIEFEPGQAATSSWGSVSSMTPLIDLPPVRQASEAEAQAYRTFVQTYQQYWKQFIDPVAIRLDLTEEHKRTTATIDVRILPLISGTDYSEIDAVVGKARIAVPALDQGFQSVWAVGADARLRREMDGLLRSATGRSDTGLGWLGGWVALGVDDRAALLDLWSYYDDSVQLPLARESGREFDDPQLWRKIGKFPIYAAAEVSNPVMLVATLAALRTMLGQVAPGMIDWGDAGSYRELPIVRVGVSRTAPLLPDPQIADAIGLHYVQTGKAIVFALNPQTLHTIIDRMLDNTVPTTVREPDRADRTHAQFVVESQSAAGAPVWTALLWLLQGQANDAQANARLAAEILLRGDPVLAGDVQLLQTRALNYFGAVPQTTRGDAAFSLHAEGAGDELSGSTLRPIYVQLPLPGSAVSRLMQELTRIRGEISFDSEPAAAGPNARSLHTRLSLSLGESSPAAQ